MLISIILGGIIGWIAGKLMHSRGGIIRNIILGIVGGWVGGFLLGLLGITGLGIIGNIAGACLILWAAKKFLK
jgi:uncharacterized membrane protein YeaQ/YmgE (transglycosylase-associated protein family)